MADAVWARFGAPKQYIEPFCGSAAMLLAAPRPAPLEVVNDGGAETTAQECIWFSPACHAARPAQADMFGGVAA